MISYAGKRVRFFNGGFLSFLEITMVFTETSKIVKGMIRLPKNSEDF